MAMTKTIPTYELYGENTGRNPDFWLHCETIASRSSQHHWEIRPHRHHNFFQILYMRGGSGEAMFDGVWHPIANPSIVTVPPDLNHGFRFSRDIDGFVITVLASHLKAMPGDRSRFGAWLAMPHLMPLDMADDDSAHIATCLRRLAQEFTERRTGRNDLLEAYLTCILHLASRLAFRISEDTAIADQNARRMELLNGLIQQHYKTHRPVTFYSSTLGISSTHLNRIVRKATGRGTHELIARKLIDEAKRELLFSPGNVQEVAYRLGFPDTAYFSRFFLRQTGQTPRAWRLAERGKINA